MVRSDAFHRTFFIRAAHYGSAFIVTVEGVQVFVTAKHLLDPDADEHTISIFLNNGWKRFSMLPVGIGLGQIDVAVFECPAELLSSEFALVPAEGEFTFGQDMYFLGFPYKLWGNLGKFLDGLPCAFVKRGTLSFYDTAGERVFYVDAINNEGFSGGPLLFFPLQRPNQMLVAGVVSKFRVERETVRDVDDKPTGLTVPYNTGLLVAYGMTHVVDLARRRGRS